MARLWAAARRSAGTAAGFLIVSMAVGTTVYLRPVAEPPVNTAAAHADELLQDDVQSLTAAAGCEPVSPGQPPRRTPSAVLVYTDRLHAYPYDEVTHDPALLAGVVAWCIWK